MKDIRIGNVSVPIVDYAIGASAVLGIRDSGKTVTSKGIAEQLLDSGVPIIVFDAVGKWRWMKVAGEGDHGKAFKVVVAGGREPDLPLSPHSVTEIIRASLRERIPLIIDLFSKELSKADWRKIVQTAIHIIHYENEGGAVHVFLEEAAEFVPQKVYDGETYAEVEKLVRMGGNASVGITLINQRSQEVNKAVLDNCSTALVLGCQVGKNAIEAVEKWIDRLDPETADEVTKSLPKLQSGEAWVWTRKSLDRPSREKMPMCRSLHPDRRTPEAVLKQARPADTAEFVAKLTASIPKVIEQAKANDPAELRRTIAALKKQLEKTEITEPKEKTVEVPVFDAACKQLLERVETVCSDVLSATRERAKAISIIHKWLVETRNRVDRQFLKPSSLASPAHRSRQVAPETAALAKTERLAVSNGTIPIGEKKILRALIQYPDGLARDQLTVLTGYKRSSRDAYIARLREKDYVGTDGDTVTATQRGQSALPDAEPLPTGRELQDYWRGRLPQGELAILEQLISDYPNSVDRESLVESTGYKRSSRDAYIARLRARQLVVEPSRGEVRASEHLF